ncbi:MAG TPA: DUF6163 family protein [Rhizobiaceae bacterium]
MTDITDRGPLRPTLTEQAFVWFQRLIAGYCLLLGILYWVRLIGVYDGALWRFDLMPVHWQVAAVTLAAFYPFAAIGLWMLASWGPVIWVICAATETAMYFLFPDLYGHRLLVVSGHLAVVLLYTAFRVLIHWQSRRAER